MLKRHFLICSLVLLDSIAAFAVKPLVYLGDTLEWNIQWKRTQCGTVRGSLDIQEVSGIACSRVTPGYIWMQSDECDNDPETGKKNRDHIIATDEKGENLYMRLDFLTLKAEGIRYYDWEDMSGGVYEGKNYLFVGAFGDNEEVDDYYTIVYFEEPEIVEGTTIEMHPSQIEYVYPDGKSHNCEAIMYDNVDQMIYIITKVYYNVCQVFSLSFRLDYGDEVQTLKYECDLGVKSDLGDGAKPYKGFHLVTAADISPDGKYILIKNHNNIQAAWSWVLLFTREDGESVAETLRRQTRPEPLKCYNYEWQGEAICWLDNNTFYTTSDSDGEPPIFKYTKKLTAVEYVRSNVASKSLVMMDNVLYIQSNEGLFTIDGRRVQ